LSFFQINLSINAAGVSTCLRILSEAVSLPVGFQGTGLSDVDPIMSERYLGEPIARLLSSTFVGDNHPSKLSTRSELLELSDLSEIAPGVE
jgi:hypothetical protein